ncbi:hypothetical protein [Nocardioides sp.]|uniref:hypothetical protein n=1 Tax=Nocardioides sp. TaxID=35761 RepID=UPI003D146694
MRAVRRRAVGVMVAAMIGGCAPATAAQPIIDDFSGTDGLIASSGQPAEESPWVMTSGTLIRSSNHGWTGRPDDGRNQGENGSAVFRMVSTQRGFGDVDIRLQLRVDDLVHTPRTPAQDFDGAHVWVRYESEEQLYAISVDRRDGVMVIKKKCAGGPSNGGRYVELAPPLEGRPILFGRWQTVEVAVRDLADGSVRITARRDGWQITAVDRGLGCAPLRGPGGVGIRGDNAELRLDDVSVQPRLDMARDGA